MKYFCKYFVIIIVVLVHMSCTTSTTDPSATFTVSGYIYLNYQKVSNVQVNIDYKINLIAKTDDDGYFEIENVLQGNHELNAVKTYSDGSFTQNSYDISVNSDVFLESLILPKGVLLYTPTGITDNSVSLAWSPTDADDFREYKVFRHNTSGLDENTGTLVHVSTSRNDTTFNDKSLFPQEEYFYRVYTMNEFGKLGGSNIVSVFTLEREILKNGDFESISSNNLPEYWQIWNNRNFASSDSQEVHSGKYSVHFYADSSIYMHHPFYQMIDPNNFKAGARYRLTYWIKAKEVATVGGFYAQIYSDDWTFSVYINPMMGPFDAFEWKEFSYEFNFPASLSTSNIIIGFYTEVLGVTTHPIEYWLDTVKLTRIN